MSVLLPNEQRSTTIGVTLTPEQRRPGGQLHLIYRAPPEAGGGHGLTAMRERATRAGGSARAGPTADGWLVELEVPG